MVRLQRVDSRIDIALQSDVSPLKIPHPDMVSVNARRGRWMSRLASGVFLLDPPIQGPLPLTWSGPKSHAFCYVVDQVDGRSR